MKTRRIQNTRRTNLIQRPRKTSSHPRLLREFSLVRKTIGIIVRNNGRLCRVKQELGESQQASREDNSGTYGGITAVIPSYPKMTSIGRSC